MAQLSFADAALILAAHGSTQNADSCKPVYQHAGELRRRGLFAEVRECFWRQEPRLADVLPRITAPRVFVVPVCVSEGWLTQEVIPRELGLRMEGQKELVRVQRRGGRTFYYCAALGTHPSMTGVLLARAQDIVAQHPFPARPKPAETALFLAGHGTERNRNSRRAIENQVALIRAMNQYAEVHDVYLEESPQVSDCYRLTRARNLIVVPFFISDGLHTREDIPRLLGEPEPLVRARAQAGQPTWRNPTERHGQRVWLASAIGSEPHLTEVIVERVREISAQT